MIRTFDGVWGGRSDYAKYALTSYNEGRASGFFCKYTQNTSKGWPSNGTNTTSTTHAGITRSQVKKYDEHDMPIYSYEYTYHYVGITFNYDELAELRGKDVKNVRLVVEAEISEHIDVDMKKNSAGDNMARCDKNQNGITVTKLGKWHSSSPNYVSRTDGVCTFDLTNDTGGNFAGVPKYGYVFGFKDASKRTTVNVEFIGDAKPNNTSKRATLYVVTNERQSTLSFDANGGSGAPASISGVGVDGEFKTTVPATVPTYAHKNFLGWTASSAGTGHVYQPGENITVSGDTTLYAKWEKLLVEVKYLPGTGGTGEFTLHQYSGDEINIVDVSFFVKKPGCSITGYADTDGGEKAYDIGDHYTLTDSGKTFYACWQTATYTVTYDANGGSGAPDADTKTGSIPLTLSATVPTRAGYQFMGWALEADGEPVYQPGDAYTDDASVTLYAVWEERGGLMHVATHQGVKTAKAYVMTENGLVRASAYVMTGNGAKKGI